MANISSKNSIDHFIDELAAKRPSPGGGAAAALAGALGASLLMKVANFTAGKDKYKEHEKEAKSILKQADKLKGRLSSFIEKDAKAYKRYSKERSKTSMREATRCVTEIAGLSKEGLELCRCLKRIGNVNLKGDLYTAEVLLNSSVMAAGNLVKLNKRRTRR